jgi:hypothetical protein
MNALISVLVCLGAAAAPSPKEAILDELSRHLPELTSCYVESGSTKKGTVVVEWSVNDLGEVVDAKGTIQSTIRDLGIHLCITTRLKALKFPVAPKGQVISASYTFDFTK